MDVPLNDDRAVWSGAAACPSDNDAVGKAVIAPESENRSSSWSMWPSPLGAKGGRFLGRSLPSSIWRLVAKLSAGDQVWLCGLSIGVALLDTVPLELQRRIVNHAIKEGQLNAILLLCATYAATVIAQGSIKFLSNMYRAWVSENAVRALRTLVNAAEHNTSEVTDQGVKVSMVLAESEPIGGFVGDSLSEPVLHAGLMISVTLYLIYLQPLIALVIAGVFVPQMIFVPLFQRLINRRAQQRIQRLREASAGILQEANNNAEQNKLFRRVFNLNISVYKLKYGLNLFMNMSHQLGISAILAVGGMLVLKGHTQVGTVVAFISGLGTVKDPWGDLVSWYQSLRVNEAKYELLRSTLTNAKSATTISSDD